MNNKPEQMAKPVTLADLERDGKLAWLYCNDCGRERDIPPTTLGLPPGDPGPRGRQTPQVLRLWEPEGDSQT